MNDRGRLETKVKNMGRQDSIMHIRGRIFSVCVARTASARSSAAALSPAPSSSAFAARPAAASAFAVRASVCWVREATSDFSAATSSCCEIANVSGYQSFEATNSCPLSQSIRSKDASRNTAKRQRQGIVFGAPRRRRLLSPPRRSR